MRIFFLIAIVVCLNSASQLLFKAAALAGLGLSAWPWIVLPLVCLGFSFIFWMKALHLKPLSFLHPFAALVYLIVPALASIIFHENVSNKYVAGIILIVAGISITSCCVRQNKCK